VILNEFLRKSSSKEINAMAAPPSIDLSG